MIIIKIFQKIVRNWLNYLHILQHNQGVDIPLSVVMQYDDINAIKISPEVNIGEFVEFVVVAKSPHSNVPGRLIIEKRAVIGSYANIRAAGGEIYIGQNCLIAQHVSLIACNHTISHEKPYRDLPWNEEKTGIFIDENVWIGCGVTILPGCRIGKNSVIGAGSVVTISIPANEVWAGVPARKIKDISCYETENLSYKL
ncbi:acyltransferase [aff. Roholtiella sp. LEGE 12411]|uniref:acyltransferase n=1 Tax=aff. Roholtiella sp. LEGE 12411 TaxID=1828822 RepID=UPI00187EE754|nr:acyltransferase [aff. Roholtiella sp. LEGE 12411]MBE9037030.1 acyltransferase [aff. Roholtiella sp. LEGE 12411]